MEPISLTLGAIGAAALAEAQQRAASGTVDAGETALRRLAKWLHERFPSGSQATGTDLTAIEPTADVAPSLDAVAKMIDERADRDSEFRVILARLVSEVQQDTVALGIVTEVYGNARVGKIVNIGRARNVRI